MLRRRQHGLLPPVLVLAVLTGGCTATSSPTAPASCTVTQPNGQRPPEESAGGNYYGNAALVTILYPAGVVQTSPDLVQADGSIARKFPWWRLVEGQLGITGRRLDGAAPPAHGEVPDGYGSSGFQASGIVFPSPGCWEITGTVGSASLTFVTWVTRPPAPGA